MSFDFIFVLHLMRTLLSISADSSNALQRKEQDILNAMDLVSITKAQMSGMRSVEGWLSLMNEVKSFCSKNNVEIPAMDAQYVRPGRPRRNAEQSSISYELYYRIEILYSIIDLQLKELDERFPDNSSSLLKQVAYLNPDLLRSPEAPSYMAALSKMYPKDFSEYDLNHLGYQLQNFVMDLRTNSQLKGIKSVSDLAVKMSELKNQSRTL